MPPSEIAQCLRDAPKRRTDSLIRGDEGEGQEAHDEVLAEGGVPQPVEYRYQPRVGAVVAELQVWVIECLIDLVEIKLRWITSARSAAVRSPPQPLAARRGGRQYTRRSARTQLSESRIPAR
jgi:hypothetical protein